MASIRRYGTNVARGDSSTKTSRRNFRTPLQVLAVLLIVVASCREVDATGGGLERLLSGRDPIPAAVDERYDAFVDACKERDASAAWILMTPGMQAQVDARARDEAAQSAGAGLREHFGYDGPASAFDGTAYLQGLMTRDDGQSPCPVAGLWRKVDAGPDGEAYVVVAQRPDGMRQAVRFAQTESGWWISDLSTARDDLW